MVLEFITTPIFILMDSTLGLLFGLFGTNYAANVMFGVFAISTLVSGIITFITSRVVDQAEMKRLKARMSKIQEELKDAQKKGSAKEVNKLQSEMMRNSGEMWRNSTKPMFFTMVPIILIFAWLGKYEYLRLYVVHNGYVAMLPFALPFIGDRLGWLGWYILTSFATSPLIRKLTKMEGP